jgi:hypothetical protein
MRGEVADINDFVGEAGREGPFREEGLEDTSLRRVVVSLAVGTYPGVSTSAAA